MMMLRLQKLNNVAFGRIMKMKGK